jgi:nitrite reductase (NADH) small subunit
MADAKVWRSVGPVSAFPIGRPSEVTVGRLNLGVVRAPSGVYAFRNECPHQGAPLCSGYFSGTMVPSKPRELEYGLDNEVIRCPWHGWEFRVSTGEALFGISTRRLRTFDAEVRGSEVYVCVPAASEPALQVDAQEAVPR